MQISNMQSDDHNRNRPKARLTPNLPKKSGVDGGAIILLEMFPKFYNLKRLSH